MTTTTKAGGTSGGGRAKAGTITQIIADLREVQVEMRYMRKWLYALTACMVLMLGGFGWMDAKFDRVNERLDRLYELILMQQQQPPGAQPPTPPTQQPAIPTTQEPPVPDDRPDVGRQAKRSDPD